MSETNGNGTRVRGTVLWFNPAKGYGFITSDGGEPVFVHHTHIKMPGYKKLRNGLVVEFDLIKNPQGNHADGVIVIP